MCCKYLKTLIILVIHVKTKELEVITAPASRFRYPHPLGAGL
jgi:hypothetical protein